jgi:hypothetical protein
VYSEGLRGALGAPVQSEEEPSDCEAAPPAAMEAAENVSAFEKLGARTHNPDPFSPSNSNLPRGRR